MKILFFFPFCFVALFLSKLWKIRNKSKKRQREREREREGGERRSFTDMHCADVPAAVYPVPGLAHWKIPWEWTKGCVGPPMVSMCENMCKCIQYRACVCWFQLWWWWQTCWCWLGEDTWCESINLKLVKECALDAYSCYARTRDTGRSCFTVYEQGTVCPPAARCQTKPRF